MTNLNSISYKNSLSIREKFQKQEREFLCSHATLSQNAQRKTIESDSCSILTAFQTDRDRIVYSNAFRRLKHKTQVFLSPLGDHYRTRLTHTLEVSKLSRNIARALSFNEDLVEAIALGHDLGHTPFGHGGEMALIEVFSAHFSHAVQSLRVVDILENRGVGLNLTRQVRDGILKHSKGFGNIFPVKSNERAATIEGRIVRIADIMAYLNHDLDDALRGKVVAEDDIPMICIKKLGATHCERRKTMMESLIYHSGTKDGNFVFEIGEDVSEAMEILRQFLYEKVYRAPAVYSEFIKVKKIVSGLYHYFLQNPDEMQKQLEKMEMLPWDSNRNSLKRSACDAIASMTDRYALDLYEKLFFPSPLV